MELLLHKGRLQKMSPVKLAKDIKHSPDILLAEVNKKLQTTVANMAKDNSLVFTTPSASQLPCDENKVPDSNELFRKFLQSDRKRLNVPRKLQTPATACNVSSATHRQSSPNDTIDTILEHCEVISSSFSHDELNPSKVAGDGQLAPAAGGVVSSTPRGDRQSNILPRVLSYSQPSQISPGTSTIQVSDW